MSRDAGPLGKAWTDIGSDGNWIDYGGRWARHVGGTRYHVIRFENCAEWGDGATGYHCDLQEVDTTNPQRDNALQCVGLEPDTYGDGLPEDRWPLVLAEALSSYGAYAPLWQAAGKNAHALLRAARAESRRLRSDPDAYESAMDRPVNAIGTSARNYGLGRILSSDH